MKFWCGTAFMSSPELPPVARMLDEAQQCLHEEYDVEHSTIQFEALSHGEHEHGRHA